MDVFPIGDEILGAFQIRKAVCAALLSLGLLAAGPAFGEVPPRAPAAASAAHSLEGVWTNRSMTTLERREAFKTLVIPQAEATRRERDLQLAREKDVNPIDQQTESRDAGGFARIRGQARASWLVDPPDGKLPFTPAAREALEKTDALGQDYSGPEAREAPERCLMGIGTVAGPPMLNFNYNSNYQFVQTRDYVAIVVEMNHDTRIIPLQARRHMPQALRPWMGDSLGHWEGGVLVVETTNINPGQRLQRSGGARILLSPRAKVVERFTRLGADQILYEFTVDDPPNYTQPWRGEMALHRAAGPMFEYACHEGNYSLANILAGGRRADRAAVP